jgi:hypothetical protein
LSAYRRAWLFSLVFYVLGVASYLIATPEAISSGEWFAAMFIITAPAMLLAFIVNGFVEIWKSNFARTKKQPDGEQAQQIPPPPAGWNKTFADLLAEVEAGTRESIGHPEMDWAIEYERRTRPPPPSESVKRKWETESRKRNCYCSVWGTNPATFKKDDLPEGFCGKCERCGELGHTRHFPGPVPYTGAWCDRCYRILSWTWPFRSVRGWTYLVAVALVVFAIGAPLIKRVVG